MVGSHVLWAASGQLFLGSLIEMDDSRLGDSFSFGWDQGLPFRVVFWQLWFWIHMESHQTEAICLWCLWELEEGDQCCCRGVMLAVGQVCRFSVRFSWECCVPLLLIQVKTEQEVLLYLAQQLECEERVSCQDFALFVLSFQWKTHKKNVEAEQLECW